LTSGLFDTINVYGRTQMTYNGWPLYYFGSDDAMRGSTKGVSVPSPGVWPVAVADISDPLPATIVDIVVESEAHTTLETAVIEAELAGSLSGDGPFTVFAPTDDAFAALPDGTLDALLADPTGELAEILQFHVVSGKAMSGDLSDGMKVATLQGDSIMISIDGENVSVNGANVTMADIEAQNGVVHVIDAVLLPEEPTSITETIFTSNATLVYPNPAKDRATIRYSIESNANVTLEIYNVLGSKVEMINLGSKPKGTYRQEFSVSQFKNGIYFVVLQAGNDSSRDILRVVNE
ncbi:MAG: fasciclin domain-containing protein, partial [Bacteroidales bacterium]